MLSSSDFAIPTHEVSNQSPLLHDYNCYQQDRALQQALHREGADWAESMVNDYGQLAGGTLLQAGYDANEHPPEFSSHDRTGHRIDRVIFHPAYHQLMSLAVQSGWPMLPWNKPRTGAHVARAAMEYLHHQADSGSGCPLTMSFAAVPVIRCQPTLANEWLPLLTSGRYDGSDSPYFMKLGVTVGMGLTEKQGGSDVNANTTHAEYFGEVGPGKAYSLVGHKWFLSAPMSDGFLILAQTDQGPGCFLLPRWCPTAAATICKSNA